jgi:hypothetical protein
MRWYPPARVLPGQPEDQLLNVVVHRRSSWSAAWVGPGAGDHAPVPAQERVGCCADLRRRRRPAGRPEVTPPLDSAKPAGGHGTRRPEAHSRVPKPTAKTRFM